MIKSLNFLGRPSREKLNLFVSIGAFFFVLGIIDVILNSFFEINITSVLPRGLNFFTPLIFSFIGLYYIRIEFSGNRTLDNLNKNINSNWFNATLTLLIIFVLIQNIPPLLNWLFFDADYVGVSKERVKGWVAGINHLAWFLRFEVDGQDAYPKLIEAMQNPDIFSQDTVRFEVMKQFGYFVTESTRHMSEYTPYFRTNEQTIEDFNLDQIRQDLQRRTIRVDDHYGQLLEDANTDRRLTAERSDEYACQIIEAMESDRPIVINGNVPNEGLIDNLLNLSSVEVPILIDKLGFHPMAVGELPGQLAALSRSNQAVQQMAVNAILDGDKEAAFHAIALDPLTSAVLSLGEIREMFDEMWSAHGAELASYS